MHRPQIEPSFTFTQGTADVRYIRDEQRLKQMARQLIDDYPDVHGVAYAEAGKLLLRHTGRQLDPEKVYWHRFRNAANSPRTFTGWQHCGEPVESMTFVELMLQRFSTHDQQASDELSLYGGFYTDGPLHGVYDERNEVAMLPQQILTDFWALDFSVLFRARIDSFWATHSNNFCTLARSRFLAAAGHQLRIGGLTVPQFKQLTGAVVGKLQPVMTLHALQVTVHTGPGITLHSFDIGAHVCSDGFRIVGNGWQVVYLPGDAQVFHIFASQRELYRWVRSRLDSAAARNALKAMFLRTDAARQLHGDAFDETLRQIRNTPWHAGQNLINSADRVITGDVFEHLRDIAQQQMLSDAQILMTSNSDLRKRMWIGYLSAFISVFGGLAPLGWPVALTLVGAGVANVALNADQAIHGKSARERKAGLIGAIFSSIFLVFNLPILIGLSRAATIGNATPPAVPAADNLSELTFEFSSVSDLAGLEGNVVLTDEPLEALGHLRGVQQLVNGETWISLDDMPYRVSYSEASGRWGIVDPDAPGSGAGRPVRLNRLDEWELVPNPAELAAGTPPGQIRSVRSAFWDVFMQFNLPDETFQSQLGLARQEAAINLPEVEPGGRIGRDASQDEIYIDSWGDVHRVFKTASGRYVGGRISLYTTEDAAFNNYLRTGVPSGPGQARLIEELADDLQAVGHNNNATLYRGGNGARGTSGSFFRNSDVRAGDVLVNTDISSFSENPYLARAFCSSQAGRNSPDFALSGESITFDDTSVVFELPEKHYLGATPIAPFSSDQEEVESIFMPGHYFLIDGIQQVTGLNYRFIRVRITEIPQPKVWHRLYDMRTGEPFSREQYAAKLGEEGRVLVERFFPLQPAGLRY
jgi:hypothetical protein